MHKNPHALNLVGSSRLRPRTALRLLLSLVIVSCAVFTASLAAALDDHDHVRIESGKISTPTSR